MYDELLTHRFIFRTYTGSMLVAGAYANPSLPCEIPIPDEVFRQQSTCQVQVTHYSFVNGNKV